MRDEYAAVAPMYDNLARDPALQAFYDEWRRALVKAARERGVRIRALIDLACGTGNTTIPWLGRGRLVVGVDRSAGMLRVAKRKSTAVRWYRQDLTSLQIAERADAVTCHGDPLNHVLDPAELERVFAQVAAILNPGGLFQFDLSTSHWFRWLHGREKLFHVGRDVFVATNEYDERHDVATFRQEWFVRQGRLYARRTVVVHQRTYPDQRVRSMLRSAGLKLEGVWVQRRIGQKPMRKVFLASAAA